MTRADVAAWARTRPGRAATGCSNAGPAPWKPPASSRPTPARPTAIDSPASSPTRTSRCRGCSGARSSGATSTTTAVPRLRVFGVHRRRRDRPGLPERRHDLHRHQRRPARPRGKHNGVGDYDADGDLDLLLTGMSPVGPATGVTRVFRNNSRTANTVPNAPTGLSASLQSVTSVKLSWTASLDLETPSRGLSYDLHVGTTPGGEDVVGPQATPRQGVRLVPRHSPGRRHRVDRPGPRQDLLLELPGRRFRVRRLLLRPGNVVHHSREYGPNDYGHRGRPGRQRQRHLAALHDRDDRRRGHARPDADRDGGVQARPTACSRRPA